MPEDRRQFEIIQERLEFVSHILDLLQCMRVFCVSCMFLNAFSYTMQLHKRKGDGRGTVDAET